MKALRLEDFSGGLNELVGKKLKPNEATSCQNVIFDEQGAINKRPGYQSIASINTDPIEGLYLFHKKDGTRYMLATSGTTIWKIDEQAGTATSLKTGLTNADFTFTTLGNKCYMANGKDYIQVYDGVSITEELGYAKGKYITDYYNHIAIAGNEAEPSLLYIYEFADPTKETIIEVSTDDGDRITGITNQQGNLVIFKTNSIHVLYGTDPSNFVLKEVQPNIGCIAPKSVVNIYNRIYFLYRDGVYYFDGYNVRLISVKVSPSIRKISDPLKAVGAWYDQSYWLSYPEGTSQSNNTILVYNILHQSWSKFKGLNASIFNNFDGAQDGQANISELYFGDSETGEIYQYDIGTSDNGNPIELIYSTKYLDLGQQEIIKTFRRILVDSISEGEIKINYDIDRGIKSGTLNVVGFNSKPEYNWGQVTWGELMWHVPKITNFGTSLPGGTYGSNIRFTFYDNSTNSAKIYGLTIQIRPRRERYRR